MAPTRCPDPLLEIRRYVRSRGYDADLAATQLMWSAPDLVEVAGSFVLLTYFANPRLLAVRAHDASLRTAVDGHRERQFLCGIVGLESDGRPGAGIRDAAVLRNVERLREHHLAYPGMTRPFMGFVAGLLAIAPLRLRADRNEPVAAAVSKRYWRYMRLVMRLLAADLGTVRSTNRSCREFDELTSGPSADGRELIAGFARRHPRHVEQALAIAFPASQRVIAGALADTRNAVRP
jgi:hypothetical protein